MKRQGDLIIKEVQELPQVKLLEVKSGVILKGESTGHAHRLSNGDVLRTPDGQMFLRIAVAGGKITHEEHKPVTLKKGIYAVLRTREWDYSAAKAREVLD